MMAVKNNLKSGQRIQNELENQVRKLRQSIESGCQRCFRCDTVYYRRLKCHEGIKNMNRDELVRGAHWLKPYYLCSKVDIELLFLQSGCILIYYFERIAILVF